MKSAKASFAANWLLMAFPFYSDTKPHFADIFLILEVRQSISVAIILKSLKKHNDIKAASLLNNVSVVSKNLFCRWLVAILVIRMD